MAIKRRDVFILVLILIGLLFFVMLPSSSDRWSVASAQGGLCPSGTQPPCPTETPDPRKPREVPEADALLLVAGGLSGLGTWLGWQRYKLRVRK